jgi:hypothetical protein
MDLKGFTVTGDRKIRVFTRLEKTIIISKSKIYIGERGQTAILSYMAFREANPGVSGVSDGDVMLAIDCLSKQRGSSY